MLEPVPSLHRPSAGALEAQGTPCWSYMAARHRDTVLALHSRGHRGCNNGPARHQDMGDATLALHRSVDMGGGCASPAQHQDTGDTHTGPAQAETPLCGQGQGTLCQPRTAPGPRGCPHLGGTEGRTGGTVVAGLRAAALRLGAAWVLPGGRA